MGGEEPQEHCEVCGRTRSQLKEINQKPEFRHHQGIRKCVKCIKEYEFQAGSENPAVTDESENRKTEKEVGWKKEITA